MKYLKHTTALFLFMVAYLGVCGQAFAESRVSADELKKLLSGNTAEGRYIKWKTTHKMFFEATGKLRRIDSLNNKENAEWYINDDGQLCVEGKKKRCNEVTRRDDGGYNVSRGGTIMFTFDKIVPGNPYKL